MGIDDEKPIEADMIEDADGDYTVGPEDEAFADEADDVFEEVPESFDGEDDPAFPSDASENRNMKKLLAPALVLIGALGFGAYILMNPGLIGGGAKPVPMPQAQAPYYEPSPPAAPVNIDDRAMLPPQPPPIESAQEDMADAAVPPQTPLGAFEDPMAPAPVPPGPGDEANADITETPAMPPPSAAETAAADPAAPIPAPVPMPEEAQSPPPSVPAPDMPPAEVASSSLPVEASPAAMPVEMAAPPAPPDEFPQVASASSSPSPGAPAMPQAAAIQGGEAAEGVVGKGAAPSAVTPPVAAPQEAPPPVSAAPENDAFYDSKMIVPSNPALDQGPRKVDPTQEPGSSFVVVTKTHSGQSQESLMISANRALKLGRYEAAMEMYDTLYSRNPKDPAILLGRAVAYQKGGRPESALNMYDDLLALDKNNKTALLNMLGLLREQYPETALRRLMILREKYPDNAGIVAQMGLTEAGLGNTAEALRYLGIAASLEPQNAQHMFNMGIIADRKGDRAQAVKFYEQALETDAVYGGSRSIPREQIYDRLSVLRR